MFLLTMQRYAEITVCANNLQKNYILVLFLLTYIIWVCCEFVAKAPIIIMKSNSPVCRIYIRGKLRVCNFSHACE